MLELGTPQLRVPDRQPQRGLADDRVQVQRLVRIGEPPRGEQDADMVVLLHRSDAFERDDPRAGKVDLILAKHRNRPTSTITVTHQLHYSRFVGMAQG